MPVIYNTPVLEEQIIYKQLDKVNTSYGTKIEQFASKTITLPGGTDQQYIIWVVNGMEPVRCDSVTGGPTFNRIASQLSGGRPFPYSTTSKDIVGGADPPISIFSTSSSRSGSDFDVDVSYEVNIHGTIIVAQRYSNVDNIKTIGTQSGGIFVNPFEPAEYDVGYNFDTTSENNLLLVGFGSKGTLNVNKPTLKTSSGKMSQIVEDQVDARTLESEDKKLYAGGGFAIERTTVKTNIEIATTIYSRTIPEKKSVIVKDTFANETWSSGAMLIEPVFTSTSSSTPLGAL